jgi:hypothetical protein
MIVRSLILSALIASVAVAGDVTFNKDVLPILAKNCQTCHRPGEIGPMPLLTYEGVRPWAKSIKEAVLTQKMPPWFADPRYGHFMDDRRMSDADIHTLAAWVDAGAPEGDAKDKPAPRQFADGWNIRPDVVFQMPQPYKIPAKGTVEYTYIVVSKPFEKDTWVVAGEIRPTNRGVVHHVVANVRPKGSIWMKPAQLGAEPYAPGPNRMQDLLKQVKDSGAKASIGNEFLVGYVPGMQPQRFDIDHSAKLIPAGADIVFEVHYTTNGQETEDQTKLGLELATEPPQRQFLSITAAQTNLTIPPGDANAEAVAKLTFAQPVDFVYMQPHMHLRGKDMTIRSVYPTGESETLLSVPHYDFHWQIVYYEQKPIHMPKGTRLELTAHWDNSANNKWNPDPTATIHWGDQSWQEMLAAPMAVIIDRTVDPKTVVSDGQFSGNAGAE